MNKNIARYGFIFFIITQLLFFIFPDQLLKNINILFIYLFLCIALLYLIYNWNKKEESIGIKKPTRVAVFFYLLNMLLFFIFPKQLLKNNYLVAIYLFISFILLYFYYNKKSKNEQESTK